MAHATATPAGDLTEARAINEVFGEHAADLPVTSIKGHVGHTGSASAGLEPAQQGARHVLGDGEQFGVAPAAPRGRVRLPVHQGGPVRHLPGHPPEQVAHGDLVQRDTGLSRPVGRGQHSQSTTRPPAPACPGPLGGHGVQTAARRAQ